MAFTLIRTKTGVTNPAGTTLSISSITTFTAGNMVVVSIRATTGSAAITSVVDDAGNTYTLINGPLTNTTGDIRDWMYYAIQTTGNATTVTVTFDTSVVSQGIASEFNGGGPLDKSSTGQAGSGTSGSVTSFSPTASGELIYAFVEWRNASNTQIAGTNYTYIFTQALATAGAEYNSNSGTTETAPISWTNSVVWNEIAAAFFSTTTSTSSTSSSTSTSLSTSTSVSSTSSSISTSSTSTSSTTTTTSTSSTSSSTSSTSTSTTTLIPTSQYWPYSVVKLRTR